MQGNKDKLYVFECDVSCKYLIKVWANDLETAESLCNFNDCDEYEVVEQYIETINKYNIEEVEE